MDWWYDGFSFVQVHENVCWLRRWVVVMGTFCCGRWEVPACQKAGCHETKKIKNLLLVGDGTLEAGKKFTKEML